MDLLSSMVIPWSLMEDGRESQIQKDFGNRVRALREAEGLSQEVRLRSRANLLTASYIGGVERGRSEISA